MSPTLTAKSLEDPGVAGLLRPSSLSGLGVFEQAASSRARATAATLGPALCHFDSRMPSPLVLRPSGVSAASRMPIRLQFLAKASFKNVSAPAPPPSNVLRRHPATVRSAFSPQYTSQH